MRSESRRVAERRREGHGEAARKRGRHSRIERMRIGDNVVGRKFDRGERASQGEDAGSAGELVWLQCTRLLLTLTLDQLGELHACVARIIANLKSHPGDGKFSRLKFSNAILQKQLFSHAGGEEFLMAVGFEAKTESSPEGNQGKVLVLPVSYAQNPAPFLEHATASLQWLEQTVETCRELYAKKVEAWSDCADRILHPNIPAESLIVIELPGRSPMGGFLLQDSLKDVLDFARSYFNRSVHQEVHLWETHSMTPITDLESSLQTLHYYPRVKLIAGTRSQCQISSQLSSAHDRAVSAHSHEKELVVVNKRALREAREKEEQHRKMVIEEFRHDRERVRKPGGPEEDGDKEKEGKCKQSSVHTLRENALPRK